MESTYAPPDQNLPVGYQKVTSYSSEHVKKGNKVLIVVVILVIIFLAASGVGLYFVLSGKDDDRKEEQLTTTVKTSDISTLEQSTQNTTTTFEDWKTYENTQLSYALRYPPEWELDDSEANCESPCSAKLIISKGDYIFKMITANGVGYGVQDCVFDDSAQESDYIAEYGGYHGDGLREFYDYVELVAYDEKDYRRNKTPDTISGMSGAGASGTFVICVKGNMINGKPGFGALTQYGEIYYITPMEVDEKMLKLLDTIFGTLHKK